MKIIEIGYHEPMPVCVCEDCPGFSGSYGNAFCNEKQVPITGYNLRHGYVNMSGNHYVCDKHNGA